jgi:nucleoid-associated protein YgaU
MRMFSFIKEAGEKLLGIGKAFYGTPTKYPRIFEANRPMLTHPDKFHPGQVLRIPAA